MGRTTLQTVQLALQGKPDIRPDPVAVAANRFPQMKVNGPAGGAILVLGHVRHGRQAWYSSERSIVFMERGLVVATHGGTPELRDMVIEGNNPFGALHMVEPGTRVRRRYDVMPGYRYGMQVQGTLQPVGQEEVTILGHTRSLLHIREQLQSDHWRSSNHYWIDPDNGFIWKSVQAIAPDTQLQIIQLKPYAVDLRRQ
ncbi:YjbF family lipoprotein [Stenotrophomonas sp. SY1]|uniref:YjbF family lipoprotein n=1 Tax=Stenotrophomonas sp. SY1 TaxID=477235 RepID=UPI001E58E689|nr:YjbF family lipoprotein [Stenotrophomonas sp. SY1]MCD9086653.1 YjbF family lipoprotein [Stenotrophomonas sp. SY1]